MLIITSDKFIKFLAIIMITWLLILVRRYGQLRNSDIHIIYVLSFIVIVLLTWSIISIHIERYFVDGNSVIARIHEELQVLHPQLKSVVVVEGPMSTTFHKSVINICMRDESGDIYPENHLKRVLLHEYAHCLDDEYTINDKHTEKFYVILQTLVADARNRGLFDPNIPAPKMYCGQPHS
jgi:beta-lactamase regulating signal transducer with metallopeptidase domain